LIPTKEGVLTIPATRFAYFDPADEAYHVIETQAIEVHVAPGDPNLTQNVSPSNTNPATNEPAPSASAGNSSSLKAAPWR
jgi:hypothetical protein